MSSQPVKSDTNSELQRTDVITVVLCGTGAPMEPTRAQACTAVFVGGKFLLFDTGNGAKRSIESLKLPLGSLQAVFLTHYHSDHFADLGEIINRRWISGSRQKLSVYGPHGLTKVVNGFLDSYSMAYGYYNTQYGDDLMPLRYAGATPIEFKAPLNDVPLIVYEKDDITIKAFKENHPPIIPAVGYRIEYAGKVVVISGDTIFTQTLLEQSRDADLLVAEVMNKNLIHQIEDTSRKSGFAFRANVMHTIYDIHMDVNDVAQLAKDAKVKKLALTHLVPPLVNNEQINIHFVQPIQKLYQGEIIAGDDGTRIVIPLK